MIKSDKFILQWINYDFNSQLQKNCINNGWIIINFILQWINYHVKKLIIMLGLR